MIDPPTFERVYTVTTYYDGPREGIADFRGVPHRYRAVNWNTPTWDPDDERFELNPVSPAALALALEDWAIWCRWEVAYHAGGADISTHPALPEDRARFEALAVALALEPAPDPTRSVVAFGEFRVVNPAPELPPGVLRPLEVRWSQVVASPRAV